LPNSDGWNWKRAELDPPLRAARRVREREDEQHQDQRDRVDALLRAAVAGPDRSRGRRGTRRSRAGGDRLAHHVVVLVADDVVPRDARDGPEPVGDDRADREEQHPVEPAQEADEVALARDAA
jgi:hypothetical protein